MEQLSLAIVLMLKNNLSYNKDIKPIFQNRCILCHNESVPERNWMDYKTAKKKKDKIKLRIENKTMPPYDNGITEKERREIIDWVNSGAKE